MLTITATASPSKSSRRGPQENDHAVVASSHATTPKMIKPTWPDLASRVKNQDLGLRENVTCLLAAWSISCAPGAVTALDQLSDLRPARSEARGRCVWRGS